MHYGKLSLYIIVSLILIVFSILSIVPFGHSTKQINKIKINPPEPEWLIGIIPDGGSIYSVMEQFNLPGKHVAIVSYRMGEYIDVTTIQPGDTLKLKLSKDKQYIEKMQFVQEPTVRHNFSVQPDSLIYTMESLPVIERYRVISGSLNGTLDASLLDAGLPPTAKQQINNGLETEINFSRDARNGDKFKILIKERIFENKTLPGVKVYYVAYSGERTGSKELWRYEESDPKSVFNGLYNKDGKCHSTSGVGYPLGSIHVVSKFGRRADPFSGRGANHQGVDYRARTGTPVYAVANGTVTEARYHGGWGNNVQIRHASGMESQYAHLSSMSVRAGQKVVKGQIIGRVGSTGRSTGSHLHFGLISNKKFINPTNLKMVGAEKLSTQQMQEYARQRETINRLVQQYSLPS